MKEQKFYGIHACWAIWESRPDDIVRVYLDASNVKQFGPVMKWCAQAKKAYRIVPEVELKKISDSVHHEGVCFVAKERGVLTEEQLKAEIAKKKGPMCLLYLDGVENPHNLGSILRTAAHFGVPYIIGEKLPSLSASACRIAKGGAEPVRLAQVSLKGLEWLKGQGFAVIGTSSHGGESLYKTNLPPRTILAMGAESTGVGKALMKATSKMVQIPGTDCVESLNVAVAAGLCIGEFRRQHP